MVHLVLYTSYYIACGPHLMALKNTNATESVSGPILTYNYVNYNCKSALHTRGLGQTYLVLPQTEMKLHQWVKLLIA